MTGGPPPGSTGPVTPTPSQDLLDTSDAGPAALRGSALRTAGYGLGVLLSVATAPLLIRHLGVADFGRYVTVLSLVTLAAGLTEGGLNAIALREYASSSGRDRDAVMRNLLGIRILLTVAGALAAVGFAVAAGYESALVIGTMGAGAGLLVQVLQSLLATSLQGSLRFGWVTALELLRQALTLAAVAALVLAGAGLVPFLLVQIPAGLVALVLTARLVRGLMPLRPALDPSRWWPLMKDTFPYAVATAINTVYFRVAIVVMSLVATELETGYFATSFRVVEVLIAVPALVIGAAFPILARAVRDDPERFDYAAGRILELALVGGVWLVLSIELAAQPIIDVLAGAEAGPSVPVLRIQAIAVAATFLAVAAGYPLLSLRRYRAMLIANAAALAASVAFTFVLVPLYAARGAAVATVAAEVALAAVTVGLLARERPRLRTFAAAVPPVLAAAGIAACVVFVPALPAVIDALLGGALFFSLLAAFGRFPPELGELIGGLRRRRGPQPR